LKGLGAGNLAGDPIHWGTRFLKEADFRATTTSHLANKFRAAGLVVVGRTNVPELGARSTTEPVAYAPTRNPWNPAHSAGGSSGAAAAATAAGIVPFAHASDGGGSIRNPASQMRTNRIEAKPRPNFARPGCWRILGRDGVRVRGHTLCARHRNNARLPTRSDARRPLYRAAALTTLW